MRKSYRAKPIAEINVVPYVDVMLVLLVIFMLSTPLLNQGVEVDLPQGNVKALAQDENLPIIVTVNKDAELFLNISDNPTKPMLSRDLYIELAAILARMPTRQVLIRGDKHASYDIVLSAMALLQQAGVPSIGLEMDALSQG